jgi:glycoprotein-N-acetylgalactosamine 3-beta-galactosyltransferase
MNKIISLYLIITAISITSHYLYFLYSVGNYALNVKKLPDQLVCIILTTEESFPIRGLTVWNTFAKKCDKTLFACNCSNFMINNNYSHIPFLQLDVTENYNRMDAKVMVTLNAAFKKYNQRNYWYLLIDEDTYVFVDNAKLFIGTLDSSAPLTYGYNYKITVAQGYHSGGGGILFTYQSMKRIVNSIQKGLCNDSVIFGDILIGLCSERSNVTMGNSLDELGRERFHALSLHNHYLENDTFSLEFYSSNLAKFGKECCSLQSISFHYTSPEEMINYSKIIDESNLSVLFETLHS